MSYLKLNDKVFDADVAITGYQRTFNVLDGENAERALSGKMIRDIIGTYIGHHVTISRRGNNYAGLDEVWDYLVEHSVEPSVLLEAADGQSTISYQAYYTTASQELECVANGVNFWGDIEINFTPMDAQVKP